MLPLPLIKNYYIDLFRNFCNIDFGLSQDKIYNTDIIINYETGDFSFTPAYKVIFALLIIIYILIIIMIIRQVIIYVIFKLKVNKYSVKVYDEDIITALNKEKKLLKIKRNIIIKVSKNIDTAMTTGFFHPVIFIPKREIKKESLVWILRHELGHINNYDYVYKVLCIIIIAIHWYNPFTYLLFKLLSVFSEFNCDEFVVKELNYEQRIKYGCTVLEFSTKTDKKIPYKAISMFGNYSAKIMKARLDNMKHHNKKGKFKSIIQTTLIISTMFVNSLTVFAYQEPEIIPVNANESNYDFDEISLYSGFGEPENTENKLPDFDKTQSITYYFINEDGIINKIDEHNKKAPCNHTYKNGYVKKHILNGKGGCTMEYYNAQKCTKCGNVILGTKYNTQINEKCPHQ